MGHFRYLLEGLGNAHEKILYNKEVNVFMTSTSLLLFARSAWRQTLFHFDVRRAVRISLFG